MAANGTAIHDQEAIRRVKALATPPAWTDVSVCPDPRGRLQATGRDDRGLKQYRYHARWRQVRDAVKFDPNAGSRLLAARFFRALTRATNTKGGKNALEQAIAQVAEALGNTPAVCKKCYIHPAVMAAYVAANSSSS